MSRLKLDQLPRLPMIILECLKPSYLLRAFGKSWSDFFLVAIHKEWSVHHSDAAGLSMPPANHFTCLFGKLDGKNPKNRIIYSDRYHKGFILGSPRWAPIWILHVGLRSWANYIHHYLWEMTMHCLTFCHYLHGWTLTQIRGFLAAISAINSK